MIVIDKILVFKVSFLFVFRMFIIDVSRRRVE